MYSESSMNQHTHTSLNIQWRQSVDPAKCPLLASRFLIVLLLVESGLVLQEKEENNSAVHNDGSLRGREMGGRNEAN